MSFKVLIPQDITDPGKDYLKEHGCEIEVLDDHSVENICKHVVDADAILARTADYPAAVFEAGKKLKVIARHGAGIDNFDIEAATAHGVWVWHVQKMRFFRIKPAERQITTAEIV